MEEQIELAKQLLKCVRIASMATVNADGSPHNTPYFFMYDESFSYLYWGSRRDTLHSQNIARTGQVFVTLYDSVSFGKGGLYITGIGARALTGNEITEGLRVHNRMRALVGKKPLAPSHYADSGSAQLMYRAKVAKLEVYFIERNAEGVISDEGRRQIKAADLLS